MSQKTKKSRDFEDESNRPPSPEAAQSATAPPPRYLLGRRLIFREDLLRAAGRLAECLAPHRPIAVIYLERGGMLLGRTIAERLEVPALGLNICYPLSRMERFPFSLFTLPFKEIAYRLTAPSLMPAEDLTPSLGGSVALVDDSAATGRSLELALETLQDCGVARAAVKTAVVRCGTRARSLVDYYELDEPAVFLVR
jgi:hypoxanthine phosphoribosyltransferase